MCLFTLAAFTALLTRERQCRTEFNDMIGNAWQDCVAWYMSALKVFPEDTPEGQNLRVSIPTDLPEAAAGTGSGGTPEAPIPGDNP
ncbi:MAG: hypothetical protein AUJ92_15300 [Armatimonadetes bacterium CG2_30_59_28]|nr:hypothetical protein [Armatimonadota bacterium]OIO91982.1 MAG: hypothetical protein AUJ92_15300 [Armatimonadetes bacterium CG2_30_59_28]PIU66693.1 MAG: hypothetical protein COS85_03720 [Armatimonadetes bacterium CG07_land_8_20_14_0_80_59_28]PIX39180.1 MAG: hypothetical protein COZ56_18325 [Armatimonadetes bacterium CG_4_8_14_3_um_filter_58_9]PIY41254.1 MAG: hypothetical protein COZ05_15960 [Armatimonadetes bacterium CG_4_10_14_3_um_filter_59_10]PJB75572.1 MAG: hypothetical protein CO095_035